MKNRDTAGRSRRFSSTFGGWPGLMVLMVLLYFLSIGPVLRYERHIPGAKFLAVVYAPLFWLIKGSPTGENLFLRYSTLWGVDWEGALTGP